MITPKPKIEEYRPEFRVGDTVEKQNANIYDIIANGIRGEVIKILLDTYLVRWFNGREFYYDPEYLKLISRAEEPKTIFEKSLEEYVQETGNTWARETFYGKSIIEELNKYKWPWPSHENYNKPNKKTFMNIIANAFKSKEDKALEGLGLGTTKELNQSGREEYVNFLFETDGKGTKEEFFAKIVEAYNEKK